MIGTRKTIPMRILSWILALAMVLTLIPATALTKVQADDNEIILTGNETIQVNEGDQVNLDSYIQSVRIDGNEILPANFNSATGPRYELGGGTGAVSLSTDDRKCSATFTQAGDVVINVVLAKEGVTLSSVAATLRFNVASASASQPEIELQDPEHVGNVTIYLTNAEPQPVAAMSTYASISGGHTLTFKTVGLDTNVAELGNGDVAPYASSLKFKAVGTVTVEVSADDPTIPSKNIVFKVVDNRTHTETVTLDKDVVSMVVGDQSQGTATINATIVPGASNGLDPLTDVTWTVDPVTGIVDYTAAGNTLSLTAVAGGTATVTASLVNGASAKCIVSVSNAPAEPKDPYLIATQQIAGDITVSINDAQPTYSFDAAAYVKMSDNSDVVADVVESNSTTTPVNKNTSVVAFNTAGEYWVRVDSAKYKNDPDVDVAPMFIHVVVNDDRTNTSVITITPADPKAEYKVGEAVEILATITNSGAAAVGPAYSPADITWSASGGDAQPAKTESGAQFVANASGTVVVTATLPNNQFASLTLTIVDPITVVLKDDEAKTVNITIDDDNKKPTAYLPDLAELSNGDAAAFQIVEGASFVDGQITDGTITFKAAGTVRVKAYKATGGVEDTTVPSKTIKFVVTDTSSGNQTITATLSAETVKVGGTQTLTVNIAGTGKFDATNITWTSDESVAKIVPTQVANGQSTAAATVYGLAAGTTELVVALPNNNQQLLVITVEPADEAPVITLNPESLSLEITADVEEPYIYVPKYATVSDGTLSIAVVEGDAANVDLSHYDTDKKVAFKAAGAYLLELSAAGAETKFFAVSVSDTREGNPSIDGELDLEGKTELQIGDEASVTVTITNSKLKPQYDASQITWASSDTSVVQVIPTRNLSAANDDTTQVFAGAKVVAVGAGFAVITATLPNGNVVMFTVRVAEPTPSPAPVTVVLNSSEHAVYDIEIKDADEAAEIYLPRIARLSNGNPAAFKVVEGEGTVGVLEEDGKTVTFTAAGTLIVKAYAPKTDSVLVDDQNGQTIHDSLEGEDTTVEPKYLVFSVIDSREGNPVIEGTLDSDSVRVGEEIEFTVVVDNGKN